MLYRNTQIPTIARGAVRALVKAHPDWQAFITSRGKLSAQALNSDLLDFAVCYPALAAQIESVLSMSHLDVDGIVACAAQDIQDAMDENYTPVTPLAADTTCKLAEAADNAATYDLDSILSGVAPFLGSKVRDELSKTLGPVITAANKPAVEVERIVEVEVERIVEVEKGAAPRPVASPKARRDKKVTCRMLWPTKKKDAILDRPVTLWTGVPTEPIDPFYVVDHVQMAVLATAVERGVNVWFTGPSGTGKSTIAKQFCATVGRNFVRIGMTDQTEINDLVGGMAMVNGSTVWQDGALTRAMRQPGTVILIDELTFARAGVQAIIQNVADEHRMLTIDATGEVVKAADGVVFVVADNTAGSGDEGGLYAGTNVSNVACVNRFGRMVLVDYLSAQREAEAVANHTACPIGAARHLADFVAQARRLPALAGVIISIRQMVAFVQCCQDGLSSKDAFNIAISSRMPATERAALETLATLSWSETFDALVNGTPVPATPSNSAASNAFADEQYGR